MGALTLKFLLQADKAVIISVQEVNKYRLCSHLEVPVAGGPGCHQLCAGGGKQAVNVAPQLSRFEPVMEKIAAGKTCNLC